MKRSNRCRWPAIPSLRTAGRAIGAAFLVALVAACTRHTSTAPSAIDPPATPRSQAELATDAPEIALGNLDAQLLGFERALEDLPDAAMFTKLASMHLVRAQLLSAVSDYERALELSERSVKEQAKDPASWLLRAKTRAALHLFDAARSDLDEAERRGAAAAYVEESRALIDQSTGHLESALARLEKATKGRDDVYSMGIRAAIVGERGNPAAAERMFAIAQQLHHDTSPFPLAWLYFHEGLMWERIGDLERARVLYEAAVDRLPQYVPAVSHLAGVYQTRHEVDRAIALLGPVAARTEDPECEGQLAALLIEAGHQEDGAKHRANAARAYESLLARHAEAYANHAARFYLGVGDAPKKALEAALVDLSVRSTDESYETALKAALTVHDATAACRIADRAIGANVEKHVLSLAAVGLESCGRKSRADELRARL